MNGLEGIVHSSVGGPTIRTASGAYFDLTRPHASEISLHDIATALGNLCRFTGHTSRFYSVAEHAVLSSYLVPEEHAVAALMHDAAEAYLGDVSKPLKRLLPDYRALEAQIERAVMDRFGIPLPLHDSVKRADLMMLKLEARFVMDCSDLWPGLENVPLPEERPEFLSPQRARTRFLIRAMELGVRSRP